MYNKALCFIQRFLNKYKQSFSLMVIFYGINVCKYFYILWCYFSKVITATLKVISALQSDLDH